MIGSILSRPALAYSATQASLQWLKMTARGFASDEGMSKAKRNWSIPRLAANAEISAVSPCSDVTASKRERWCSMFISPAKQLDRSFVNQDEPLCVGQRDLQKKRKGRIPFRALLTPIRIRQYIPNRYFGYTD